MGVFLGIYHTIYDINNEIIGMVQIQNPIKKWAIKQKIKKHRKQIQKIMFSFEKLKVLPIEDIDDYLNLLFRSEALTDYPIWNCTSIKLIGEESYRATFDYSLKNKFGDASDAVFVELFLPVNTIRYHYIKNGAHTATISNDNVQNLYIDHEASPVYLFQDAVKYSEQVSKAQDTFAVTIHNNMCLYLHDLFEQKKELLK